MRQGSEQEHVAVAFEEVTAYEEQPGLFLGRAGGSEDGPREHQIKGGPAPVS